MTICDDMGSANSFGASDDKQSVLGSKDASGIFSVLTAILSVGLALSGCSPPTVTGTYVAKFSNGVERLQLVQTPDQHISGEFDQALMRSNGQIDYASLTATGVSRRQRT